MLFNSFIFLIFGVLFFTVWFFFRKNLHTRLVAIIVFSFLFYGWWDWRFLFLILFTGLWDFFAALLIEKYSRHGKLFLVLSICVNLGALMIFKYSLFFAQNLDVLLSWVGLSTHFQNHLPAFTLILPVGISFYTFQSMSYTIDVYRGDFKPTKNVMLFMASISLFPHLVAGPIVRAHAFIPQLQKFRKTTEAERWNAFRLIVIGYFKKVVLADNLAPLVNKSFDHYQIYHSSIYWWIIAVSFAFQIYFDFSGYTDIARGLAKWMGYHFSMNFNHPYVSRSIKEFWTRWHISLSTWFRDYVYIPLGGSKKGAFASHRNMWITMLISGFWHGANWTYLIWGGLHAFYLSLERVFAWPKRILKIPLGKYVATAIVMFQVLVAWIFFRAPNLQTAFAILKSMFHFNSDLEFVHDSLFKTTSVFIILCILIESFFLFNSKRRTSFTYKFRFFEMAYVVLLILLCIFMRGKGNQFIYFQF